MVRFALPLLGLALFSSVALAQSTTADGDHEDSCACACDALVSSISGALDSVTGQNATAIAEHKAAVKKAKAKKAAAAAAAKAKAHQRALDKAAAAEQSCQARINAASASARTTSKSQLGNALGSTGNIKPKYKAPKVKVVTPESIAAGSSSSIQSFQDSGILPRKTARQLNDALASSIAAVTNNTVANATSSDNSTYLAAAAIKKAINDAFAAVSLSQAGLTNSTVEELQACLTTVLASGGLPDGYSCLTSSGLSGTALQATLNTTLEQFIGILPNTLLTNVFDAISPMLANLLPSSELQLIEQIEDSIRSLVATTSSASVNALEAEMQCYTAAIRKGGNTSALSCFTSALNSPLSAAFDGMVEQWMGVLPGSVITMVQNIIDYNLQNSTYSGDVLAAKIQAQISNALVSAGNTLSGNTVTLVESLQACVTQLAATGDTAAAAACYAGTPATVSMTMVLGITEQFQGYLPSSFFADLVTAATPLIGNLTANPTDATLAEIVGGFNAFFNNGTTYGAAYVSCIEEVQQCVLSSLQQSGTINAICAGPTGTCAATATKRYFLKRTVEPDYAQPSSQQMARATKGRRSDVPLQEWNQRDRVMATLGRRHGSRMSNDMLDVLDY